MTEPTCPANTGAPFLLQKERVSGAVGGRVLTDNAIIAGRDLRGEQESVRWRRAHHRAVEPALGHKLGQVRSFLDN
jgi:hypothetical protein